MPGSEPPLLHLLFFTCIPLIFAYLAGSVPFGLWLAKAFCGIDPRTAGSGNVGATNVARLCGKKWGFLALFCDVGKGALAVGAGVLWMRWFGATSVYTPLLAGLMVIIGHMFPVFLGFRGGKGVATTIGVYLALAPLPLLVSALMCVLVIYRTGFVSAGSLVLAATLPVALVIAGYYQTAFLALVTGALVIHAHRENIQRLRQGNEKPWLTKTKK